MTEGPDDLKAWDAIAANYASRAGQPGDSIYGRFEAFLWRHLGDDLTGLRVLDLGCGHGWFAGLCHERNAARTVGVDGSEALLAMARQRHPDVAFEYGDLSLGLPEPLFSEQFDRVVAHMVIMDVSSLDALASDLRKCLAPAAVVVVTLPHPAFFNQTPVNDANGTPYRKVTGYLEQQEWWISTFGGHRHYHRPLEFYVQWLAAAGLRVVDLAEPPVPSAKPEQEMDDYDRWFATIPTMIGIAGTR